MYSTYWDYTSYLLYLAQALVGMFCLKNISTSDATYKKKNNLAKTYILLIGVWTFFATFRLVTWRTGGMDAMNYISFFENSWGTFDEIQEHTASDVVFLWINRGIRLIASDYHVYFAIVYGFITYSIIQFTQRFCHKNFSFIPLLLAFYLFLRGYNTLRSNLAIAFILLGLIGIDDKKYRWAYFCMVCSALTHKAGVLFAMSIPFLHFVLVRRVKTKYLFLASCLMFGIASSIREYFIAFAAVNDLGGAYKSYASDATGNLLNSIVECFMQYLLAVVVLFSTGKIKQVAQRQGQTFLEAVNVLLYICYFDMMLIPVNAALGIWRGYEFLYIPRLCMWGFVIYVYTRNLRASTKVIINTLTFIYFVTWFTFRLSRTYEASALMPYIFDMF